MKKTIKIIFILSIFLLVNLNANQIKDYKRYWIVLVNINQYRGYIKNQTHPFDRVSLKGDQLILHVDDGELDLLHQAGLNVKILNSDLMPIKPPAGEAISSSISGGLNGIYHSYMETQTFLSTLADQYSDQADFFSIGQSLEGRAIWGLKISDNADSKENEPNIYFMGCHHAREWISVEIPLLFAEYLLKNYSTDTRVKNLVDSAQIYIIPIVNPDGLEFTIHNYRMWRKNRRYNGNLIWGVDLNRNYGYKWGYDNTGSSPEPGSQVYRGPSAFCEPETVAVRDFLLLNPPSGSISFHNYGQLILIPWGYTAAPPEDYDEMYDMAQHMRDLIYAVNNRNYEFGSGATAIYPTNGDTDDWVYGTFKVPAFCLELPPDSYDMGHFFTSEEEIQQTYNEMLPALLFFAEYSKDHFTPRTVVVIQKDAEGKKDIID